MALFKNSSRVSPLKTVNYTPSTGLKNGNDINWNNISYQVPATLPDSNYTFRITAVGDYGQSAYKEFPVTVNTPINLSATVNGVSSNAEIQADSINTFTFITSIYASSVKLNFKGQEYTSNSGQISLISNDGITKTWELKINVPMSTVTDNETGVATFTAFTPSGKSESVNVNYKAITIQAYDFTVTSILDVNWRGYYFDLNNPINGDGEKYGYPKKLNTEIKTLQMPVNSLNLVPYTRNSIKAGSRVKGYIRVKGDPDSVSFEARYMVNSISKLSAITLTYAGGDKYLFDWIIPQDTDIDSYIGFDIEILKGTAIYGNEKWVDMWAPENIAKWVLYIQGNVLDDVLFNQSH